MATHRRPLSRAEFDIAIICALRIECDAVEALFDEFWEEEQSYGKAPGDTNAYTVGRIGNHNVVLAYLPGMGKKESATTAAFFNASFTGIRLGLVVGICGGVPGGIGNDKGALLGDVVISTGVVQFDFGRQLAEKVLRKDTLLDNLGRPNREIRTFLNQASGRRTKLRLKEKCCQYLADLYKQNGFEKSRYPGAEKDKLYNSTYRHKHQDPSACAKCAACTTRDGEVCDVALDSSCAALGCDEQELVRRDTLLASMEALTIGSSTTHADQSTRKPDVHFGLVASGDLVMKSGHHRDKIAAKENVIAFEMEGAGVWDNFPTVIIKSVCDYADSHKNKEWQSHAAAVAAACMKAFLAEWRVTDKPIPAPIENQSHQSSSGIKRRYELIPIETVESYTDRSELSIELEEKLHTVHESHDPPRSLAIHGLGGCGKTQLTLDYIEKHKTLYDVIFWINVENRQTAFNSFKQIAMELDLPTSNEQETSREDIWNTGLVQSVLKWLKDMAWGTWLAVLDNADEPEWGVRHLVPRGHNGSVIITSRHQRACDLFSRKSDKLWVHKMTVEQGVALLLKDHPAQKFVSAEESDAALEIVRELDCLALALNLARASIQDTQHAQEALQHYLKRLISHKDDVLNDESLKGLRSYEKTVKAVWDISLYAVRKKNATAAQLLTFLSFFHAGGVEDELFRLLSLLGHRQPHMFSCQVEPYLPKWLLDLTGWDSRWDSFEYEKSLNLLRSYSLVQSTTGAWPGVVMHGLVRWRCQNDVATEERPVWQTWILIFTTMAAMQSLDEPPKFRRHLVVHLKEFKNFILAAWHKLTAHQTSLICIPLILSEEGYFNDTEELIKAFSGYAQTPDGSRDIASPLLKIVLMKTYFGQYRLDEAEKLSVGLVESSNATFGSDHIMTIMAMEVVASLYVVRNRFEEAEKLLLQVLETRKSKYGLEHKDTLDTMRRVAAIHIQQNRRIEAEMGCLQVIETQTLRLGRHHITTLYSIANLAMFYQGQGRYREAYKLHAEVLEARKTEIGLDHPDTLFSMEYLAETLHALGRTEGAIQLLGQAVQMTRQKFGETNKRTTDRQAVLLRWMAEAFVEWFTSQDFVIRTSTKRS